MVHGRVTDHLVVLTLSKHMIIHVPLVCPGVHLCSTISCVFFIRFIRLISVRDLHIALDHNDVNGDNLISLR